MKLLFSNLHARKLQPSALGAVKTHKMTYLVEFLSYQKLALRGSLQINWSNSNLIKEPSSCT